VFLDQGTQKNIESTDERYYCHEKLGKAQKHVKKKRAAHIHTHKSSLKINGRRMKR